MQLLTRVLSCLALTTCAFFSNAATVVAVSNGSWVSPGTWNCGCLPDRTDTIIIPENITVAITRPVTFGPPVDGKALVITVAGELDITSGSIHLSSVDRLIVLPGGKVSTRNFGGMIFSGIYALYLEGGTHVSGPATLGDGFSTLALLFFNAEKHSDGIKLTWATAGEINIEAYSVLRSTDGITFEPIGAVDGHGRSRKQKNYSFTDELHPGGVVRYRIDATDGNGLRATIATLDLNVDNPSGLTRILTDDAPRRR
jgi:hypothetical protein